MSDDRYNSNSNANANMLSQEDNNPINEINSNSAEFKPSNDFNDHDLENKLASIDTIISNCHSMMAQTPAYPVTSTNPNKARHTRDLNDELSDVDEFELTKSLRES